MRKRKRIKHTGLYQTPKVDFDALKTPEMLRDEARVERQNEQYRLKQYQAKLDKGRAQIAHMVQHPSTHELQAVRSDPKTATEWLLTLPDRLNAALSASREPDLAKRNSMFKLITTGKMLVATVVPFMKRPRTLAEILLVQKVKRLMHVMIDKHRNEL